MKTKWVCVTKNWNNYTYGKVYEGEKRGELLDVQNDMGERTLPSLFGKFRVAENKLEKIYYFITINEWREKQINQIL